MTEQVAVAGPLRRGLTTRRKVVMGASALVMAGAGWVFVQSEREEIADDAKAAALRRRIESEGGFAVATDHLQARVGPGVVLPDRPVTLVDLGPMQLGPMTSLAAAQAPYPKGFVKRFIDTVALADSITFWGDTTIGGFFFPRGICLNYGGWEPALAASFSDVFHHELSSLVRLAAAVDEARWTAFNAPGAGYLSEAAYRALLKDGGAKPGTTDLHEMGFVRPYGRSSIDDDWNTYAEQIFGHGSAFAALIKPYQRMRGKTALLIDAYQQLDARWAPYFESTGLRAAVGN